MHSLTDGPDDSAHAQTRQGEEENEKINENHHEKDPSLTHPRGGSSDEEEA
jgi:hypothetical protein